VYLYPDDLFEKLEFDKVIELTIAYCKGQRAKEILAKPTIFHSIYKVRKLLTEVQQIKALIEQGNNFPLRSYENIDEDIFWLKKINFIPELESIHRIYTQIWNVFDLVQFFESLAMQSNAPAIFEIMSQIEFDIELIKTYHKLFDDDGNIKRDASKELKNISRLMDSKKRELDRTFNSLADKYFDLGYLKDNKETLRNGKRVLSVSAENKRKIKGIIHDESSTGRTVFIEPEDVLHINNDLFELEAQRRHEIRKIINDLCIFLRPLAESLILWQRIIVRLDLIHAKSKMAIQYGGQMPKLVDDHTLELIDAKHPYLVLLNNEVKKEVVPFNLKLDKENRILLISGPNAGGKSVTMKAIGLISLMLQSGMLVTVDPSSEIGVFNGLFVDIGDQQSLEDDLSTYSSRLSNMKVFLEKVKSSSLFCIDEFGSGTDPKLGGAIAQSILHELVKRKAVGVITTHYSNLKMYAYKYKGMLNGAMEFDKVNLKPTYRLSTGKPGSSYAFEIANKAGIPEKVLKYAKNEAGANTKAVDQLLIDLQEEKRKYENQLANIQKEKESLERLIKSYENAFGDLELKRKRMKMEKKQLKLKDVNESKRELNELIKDLRKEKKLDKAEELAQQLKVVQTDLVEELEVIKDDVYSNERVDISSFKVGDFVKMRSGGASAEILSIEKGKARIAMGLMNVTAPLKELVPAKTPIDVNQRKSVVTEIKANPYALESKLDLREYRRDDALDFLQEFLDNALMSNMPELKIIHGKGAGVLRNAVHQKLKEYKDIKKIWHPKDEEGGIGVTYVKF